jgi:hypothetical protein
VFYEVGSIAIQTVEQWAVFAYGCEIGKNTGVLALAIQPLLLASGKLVSGEKIWEREQGALDHVGTAKIICSYEGVMGQKVSTMLGCVWSPSDHVPIHHIQTQV